MCRAYSTSLALTPEGPAHGVTTNWHPSPTKRSDSAELLNPIQVRSSMLAFAFQVWKSATGFT